ncbi:MAG TPA: tRNA lysidine(34) synthetase TilS [Chthoniobacterales bacterium]|nr:tRNA lysidine(34) synthetase TilS [Chthoniobacterales bacterium]
MARRIQDRKILLPEVVRRFPPAAKYLAGVSGGRDSVALLHALSESGYRRLVVCHLDHRLRGRASAADARFVRQLAERLGFEFEGAAADVRGFATEHRQSLETAARAVRYAFFVDVARRRRCRTIFLAHHADDLIETFLFNLFRGAGAGRVMRTISVHQIGRTRLTVVRPLLHVWRADIDEYVQSAGLNFREDASNAKLDRARNRMRHKIIPALEKEFGRTIRKSIWRAAMIAAEEDELIREMIPDETFQREKLRTHSLGQQPVALQRRIIHEWLRHHAISNIGFDVVERVRALLEADIGPAKVNLPGDRYARRRAGELFLE